ncbi:MAG: hypothetical protein QUU85_00140, partial [Candidatus Eisenbacteria bacterium]|nr:hypothetical protein [Candidatus Eisenbacteria bacterium]
MFLRSSAACAMAAIGSAARSEAGSRAAQPRGGAAVEIPANGRTGTLASGIEEATIDDLAAGMQQGRFTSLELVRAYRERIEATNLRGLELRAVLELNPDCLLYTSDA